MISNRFFGLFHKIPAVKTLCRVRTNYSTGKMPPGKIINIGEHRIHYVQEGSGKNNLLLIPGALGSAMSDFPVQLKTLNKNKYSVTAWDPPGYGFSRPPERTYPLTFFHRDAKVCADFLKAINISKTSVIGWSDGGIVALILAAENPQLMEKLIVFGSNAYVDNKDMELYESVRDIDKWSPKLKNPLVELYGEDNFRRTWSAWVDAMGAINKHDGGDICRKQLSLISCPTLILHGKKDSMVPQFHPEYLKKNINNCRYVENENGKHHLHMQFPEWFNKQVDEFITD